MEDWEIEINQRDERNVLIEQLEEYVKLEGSEIGEACSLLCQLAHYSYCISDELVKALDKELVEQLTMFKEQTTIIERTETRTQTYRELEWIEENNNEIRN